MITETSKDLQLFHHGVKGMKWGVRRKDKDGDGRVDGPPPGKKSSSGSGSGSGSGSASSEGNPSSDAKKTAKLKNKPASELSNKELKEVNERMNLEQNYNRLINDPASSSTIDRGMRHVQTGLKIVNLATQIYQLKNNPLVKLGASAIANKISGGSAKPSGPVDLVGLFPNPRPEDRGFA